MQTSKHICVQEMDFDLPWHYARLRARPGGAVCLFTGLVRDLPQGGLAALLIEHFPGMAERRLEAIVDQAATRWPLAAIHLVHRFGRLEPGEQIVLVGCLSDHRGDAFDACRFIMDYLKTDAPFWKKTLGVEGEAWVEANNADQRQIRNWNHATPAHRK